MKTPEIKPTHSHLIDEARDAARAYYELAQLTSVRKASNDLLRRVIEAKKIIEGWDNKEGK